MDLMSLLIFLIVFLIVVGAAFWIVRTLAGAFQIPAPIVAVIYVVIVIIALALLLQAIAIGGVPLLRLHR